MALKLAGEEFSVVQGLDVQGYLREIVANDTDPGLNITQSGSGLGLHVASGVAKFASDVDVLGVIKNTGSGNGGRVQIDDEVMITNLNSSWYLYLRDTNWGLLYDVANGLRIKFYAGARAGFYSNTWEAYITDDTEHNWYITNRLKNAKETILTEVVTVNYNDASPKTLFTAPSSCHIVDVLAEITTPFSDAAATLDIGDGSDADGFVPSASITENAAGVYATNWKDKGAYLFDSVNKSPIAKFYTTATAITATIAPGTSTTGVAKVYIKYTKF